MTRSTSSLQQFLTFEPTLEQVNALNKSKQFLDQHQQEDFLIIRGSAGTGKTSIVKAITDHLSSIDQKFYLAAPTGKAAKVINKKTGYKAKTIHSLIYNPEPLKYGCGVKMVLKKNESGHRSVFIIDEASMISDKISSSENFVTSNPLLTDLIGFIKQGNSENQIIFIGDVFQLPPVGSDESPALNPKYLENKMKLKGSMVELTEVKRQGADSYILKNATALRNYMTNGTPITGLTCRMLSKSTAALYKFMDLFNPEEFGKVTVLAWTNRDVNWFNSAIRDRLGFNPLPLVIGDQFQLHQNWFGDDRSLMKGDTGIVRNVDSNIESKAGLQFINTELEFASANGEPFIVTTKVLLDVLRSTNGLLHGDQENTLYAEAMKYNPTFRETRKPSDDEFVGAMRIRYGYATTCHKAQGGEWDNVILHPYMPKNDYRWQYTAITRAAKELYSFAA